MTNRSSKSSPSYRVQVQALDASRLDLVQETVFSDLTALPWPPTAIPVCAVRIKRAMSNRDVDLQGGLNT